MNVLWPHGSRTLAAVGATASRINLIVNLFIGLSVGTSVIVARDSGADRPKDVILSVHTSIALIIIGEPVVMVLGIVLCKPLLTMMGTPRDILNLTLLYMRIFFLSMPAKMIYNFATAILHAVGDSRPMYYLFITGTLHVILNLLFVIVLHMSVGGVASATVVSEYLSILPMICTLIGICLMRIVWLATIFTRPPTEIMLFACYPVTWTLAGLGQVLIFFYTRRRIRIPASAKTSHAEI